MLILKWKYITKASTNITVTSEYFKEIYTYDITVGKIDVEKTYGELVQKDTSTAGDIQTVVIYTNDVDGNIIDFLAVEEEEKFVFLNTNIKISKTVSTKASDQSLFVLDLYDKEWNKVTDENAVKNLIIITELIKAEIYLCVKDVGKTKNTNIFSSNTANENKCYYLVNENIYNFVASKKGENDAFPVQIINVWRKNHQIKKILQKLIFNQHHLKNVKINSLKNWRKFKFLIREKIKIHDLTVLHKELNQVNIL